MNQKVERIGTMSQKASVPEMMVVKKGVHLVMKDDQWVLKDVSKAVIDGHWGMMEMGDEILGVEDEGVVSMHSIISL